MANRAIEFDQFVHTLLSLFLRLLSSFFRFLLLIRIPEEWLYQFWGVVGGIAFAKEGFTLDSVYYDEHPIEKQCMTALLRSPKRLYVATLFDYVNPVDNERCDADHSALYDFLAEGKADDRLHIEPAGATREDLLAACTETAHWEVEGGTDTTILHITPEHGQKLRLVYRFGEN